MPRALLAILVVLAVPAAQAGAAPRASLPDVEDEVMCPVCGTLLNQAEAPQADRQRAFIRRLIDQGHSKEEIKRRLVEQYGPGVLATPRSEGFDLAAYLVPIGLGVGALVLLAGALVRWRRRPSAPAEPAPRLSLADARRLEEDMARRDP